MSLVKEHSPRTYRRRSAPGTNGLDSFLLRDVLAVIQGAARRGRTVSMRDIARDTDRSTSLIARYCQALRDSGHIVYEDFTEGTIRVRSWM